jgi:hypothetical protein
MRSLFRRFALGVGALALVGFVAGVTLARWMDSGEAEDVTASLGPASREAQVLPLTDEQRAQIFDGVMRINNAPVAHISPLEPADTLPKSVALQDLPPVVARVIPQVDGYKFVKLDDRILLVDPKTRVVVAWMPRYKLVLN